MYKATSGSLFSCQKSKQEKHFPQKCPQIRNEQQVRARGLGLSCNSTAQNAHSCPTLLARSYNCDTIPANFGPEPPKAISKAMQSHELISIMGKGLLCASGDLISLCEEIKTRTPTKWTCKSAQPMTKACAPHNAEVDGVQIQTTLSVFTLSKLVCLFFLCAAGICATFQLFM